MSQSASTPAPTVTRRTLPDGSATTSLLGFGLMRLPKLSPDKDDIDYEVALPMFRRAIESGVTYFDTAYMYHGGLSEKCVGDLLSTFPRDSYTLADKMPVGMLKGPDDTARVFEEQLARTRAGHFDFYLLHAMSRDGWRRALELGVPEYLERKKAEGVIRRLGFSFHDSPEALREIVEARHWDFVQIQLNYYDWNSPYRSREQYEVLEAAGLPVMVMEPVRGGALANLDAEGNRILREANPDVSIASWALRFAASLPNVAVVLSGMSTPEQLEDNIATFSPLRPLDEAEHATLARALEAFRRNVTVNCTGCRYCVPCPAGVPIPDIFSLANRHHRDRDDAAFAAAYDALPVNASACVKCWRCARKCPQHIHIPGELAKIDGAVSKLRSNP